MDLFQKVFSRSIFSACLVILFACTPNNTWEEYRFVNQVYPQLDTENSRWFFFSSACRPFGMVNLSPDTQTGGAWGSGYRYNTDTIKGFSHIHAWQLSGLSVMPVTITGEVEETIFSDFYSRFSHETEIVLPGYHFLELDRYAIQAEITSTRRVGFHRYTFKGEGEPALLVNLNTLLGPCENMDGVLEKSGKNAVQGALTNAPTRRRPKPTRVFFHIDSDSEIEEIVKDDKTGNYLLVFDASAKAVQLKAGISYTSVENAKNNVDAELAHWDFEKVVAESKDEWNALLGRVIVEGNNVQQQRRFYTDLWHALQGRRTISDVNGAYPDDTGDAFRIGQIPLDEEGKPRFNHYNSDSFWGAQWTLNTLWGLVYPDIYREFVLSLMQYFRDGGLVPRGPSGGNYTFVMTGASSTPFIVSAIQKGIITENLSEIYHALKKNHLPGGIMSKAGYEHATGLGGGLGYYMKNGWVPYPIPEGQFGFHQDGAGLTLEYAYQDWTLAQLALKLGYADDYAYFMNRSGNYRNVYDAESTWMRPKDVDGEWLAGFDPYSYRNGFIESNAAQSTWFVPHDIPGLAALMGGEEEAAEKLNAQFETARQLGFTSGDAHAQEQHPEYSRVPINYGNQPSIQTVMIFHQLGRPGLSHYWSRAVVDSVFSGLAPNTGYNGDEDQGLMGSLAVLMKMGLFQLNGGTGENPVYYVGSPIFDKVTIQLHPEFYEGDVLTIEMKNNSAENVFVGKARINNAPLEDFRVTHAQITGGSQIRLEMVGNELE